MPASSSRRRLPGAIVLAIGMVTSAGAVWHASNAAFTATTANPGNTWTTGTVVLDDNDGGGTPMAGTALFNGGAMKPGDTIVRCINVTYSGTVDTAAPIKFYTTTTNDPVVGGNTLGTYLQVKIDEGTGSTNNGTCAGFSSSSTIFDSTHNQTGSPTAAVPVGTMADLTQNRTGYANAVAGAWTPTTSATTRSYQFTVSFPGSGSNATDNTMQGKTLTTTFTWEARSN